MIPEPPRRDASPLREEIFIPPAPGTSPPPPPATVYDPKRERRARAFRPVRVAGICVAAMGIVGVGAALALARYGGTYRAEPWATTLDLPDPATVKGDPADRAAKLAARLTGVGPREIYVAVDTHANRLRVFRG